MNSELSRLISFSGDSLGEPIELGTAVVPWTLPASLWQELLSVIRQRNGFYAFESALLFRALDSEIPPIGLRQWNEPDLWKQSYRADLTHLLFFAEDIFGVQFCLGGKGVGLFDPETGNIKEIAPTLEGWAAWLLKDSRRATGWPFSHFWQLRNGPLRPGTRLLPKKPFVLGGEFVPDNFYALNEVEGMRFRANIANQIKACPDGSSVLLKVINRSPPSSK